MLILAVNVMEKIHAVPKQAWVNMGLFVLFVIGAIVLWRIGSKMNKITLTIIVGVFGFVLFINWVYERKEPEFLTPLVDKIAPFLPSAPKVPPVKPTPPPAKPGAPAPAKK